MSTKPRECYIFWNGHKSRGEWRVSCDWESGPKDAITIASLFIEHSAHQALEQKLAVAVRALESANKKLNEINETFNHHSISVNGWHLNGESEPMVNFFNENDWAPEALALIKSDAQKEPAP